MKTIRPFDCMAVREEIVRCRNCKFSTQKHTLGGMRKAGYQCKRFAEPDGGFALVHPDGFCAWGERREP